ncbi:hypothetical protein [Motilibacter deserti]|uniref:hypothetical protein n=1 Tax=Motilibacter deserti TaxID=2714956 RepID=UPI0018C89FFB|nr:hypothetical protein [Motilibacter deserti]
MQHNSHIVSAVVDFGYYSPFVDVRVGPVRARPGCMPATDESRSEPEPPALP